MYYSIEDICQRLKSGAEGELKAFQGPASGPQESKRCTLNEVMKAAPKKDETSGAQPGEVLSEKMYWGLRAEQWGLQKGEMLNQGAQTYIPSTEPQKIAAGYHNGEGRVQGDEDLKADNILNGIELFGVIGNHKCPAVPECVGTAVALDVLAGKTFSTSQEVNLVGTMVDQGAKNYTPSVKDQPIEKGYYDGGMVKGDVNLVSSNIKAEKTIFGVSGDKNVVDTSSGDAVPGEIVKDKKAWVDGKEVIGSLSEQSLSNTSTTVAAGIYAATTLETVDSDLVSSNIKKDVTIFGVLGDSNVVDTSSGDATASDILKDKKAWVAGEEVVGTGQSSSVLAAVPKTGEGSSVGVDLPNPRFTDNSNGTITDNLTGLIWLKDASCMGNVNWNEANTQITSLNSGTDHSCSNYDKGTYSDWRLPSINELRSLIHWGFYDPALSNKAGTSKWGDRDPFTDVHPARRGL